MRCLLGSRCIILGVFITIVCLLGSESVDEFDIFFAFSCGLVSIDTEKTPSELQANQNSVRSRSNKNKCMKRGPCSRLVNNVYVTASCHSLCSGMLGNTQSIPG